MLPRFFGRHITSMVALFGLCCGIGLWLFKFGVQLSAQQAIEPQGGLATSPRPFTATVRRDLYDPQGKLGRSIELEYIRFSDRSTIVFQHQTFPRPKELYGAVRDLARGRIILIENYTRSVLTVKLSRDAQLKDMENMWEETCPSVNDGVAISPSETILGYSIKRVTKRWSNDWITERWMAPDLGCFTMHEIDMASGAKTETTVVSIREGEPSRDLLNAPPGYVERSPDDIETRYKAFTGERTLWGPSLLQKLRKQYSPATPQ